MSHSHSPSRPIAWALLSQTIWLPLLGIDLHDRWQARVRVEQEIAAAASGPASSAAASFSAAAARTGAPASETTRDRRQASAITSPISTGLLLGSASHALATASQGDTGAQRRSASGLPALMDPGSQRPVQAEAMLSSPSPLQRPQRSAAIVAAGFRNSELLGGDLSIADLQRPAMPSLALAEQARWAATGDPLAPLPALWREPMRRALQALPSATAGRSGIQAARVVHVPSSRVRASTTVPLVLQSDGSVDILGRADDPAVLEEVKYWSRNQPSAGRSGMTATLLHLEPLPANPAVSLPGRSNATPQPRANPSAAAASSPMQPPAIMRSTRALAGSDPAPLSKAPLPSQLAAPSPAQPVASQAAAIAPESASRAPAPAPPAAPAPPPSLETSSPAPTSTP
jgi:hypothetical protein